MGAIQERNAFPYKYAGKKPTDFRLPRGLEDRSQHWYWRNVRLVTCTMLCSFVLQTLRRSVRSFYKLYEVLFVRATNSTKFCSFVRSFYKLYEVLFVRSTNSTKFCSFVRSTNSTKFCSLSRQKWTFVLYVWSSTERGYDQYDRHKYHCSSNWWLKHACSSDGPCILKRYFT